MAEDTASANESHERRECMPCGGSGQVISNLGGTPSKVSCPWCAGSGVRDAHADAQAAWRAQQGGEHPAEDAARAVADSGAADGDSGAEAGADTT